MNRPASYVLGFLASAALGGLVPPDGRAAELAVGQHERGVTVEVDGKLFSEYLIHTGPKPILWPIIGPTGAEMTRAYPMEERPGEKHDHPHQRSFWFTHGNVNGVDFWSEQGNHGRIAHRDFVEVSSEGDSAVVATRNDWLAPDGKRVCQDERRLTFRAGAHSRTIDFEITLRATDGPVKFGDTKEGSMGIRIPTVMDVNSNQGGHIVTSEGLTDRAAWGKSASWVDYHAPIDGRTVGIAVMNHPTSFRYPTRWHVRDYGLFAANPFGLKDFEGNDQLDGGYMLPAGETLRLRYRFVFHEGDAKTARIAEAFADYARSK